MAAPVTRENVLLAAETIHGRVHRTPTFTAASLGDVTLKAELFQKTGSFKVRGVLNKLSMLSAKEKARGVIGISAGNHAQALAWGAAREGIDCLVVMWTSASEAKIAATRSYGAAVDLEAGGPGERLRPAGGADRGDREGARAPVQRPGRDRRSGDGRARAARGRAGRRDRPRPGRRRRARLRDRCRDRRPCPGRRRRARAVHRGRDRARRRAIPSR